MAHEHDVVPSHARPTELTQFRPEQQPFVGEQDWPALGQVPTLQVFVVGSQLSSQHSLEVAQVAPMGLHPVPASEDWASQVPVVEHWPVQQSAFAVHTPPVVTHAEAQMNPPSVGEQTRLQQSSGEAQPAPLPRQAAPPQATPPSHTPAQRLMPDEDSTQ